MFGDKGVNLRIGDSVRAGLNFTSTEWRKGRLLKNLTGQPHTGPHLRPIVGMAHIIEQDFGLVVRVCAFERHCASAFGAHGTDMGLKAMFGCQRRSVIIDRHGKEMILDIGIFDSGAAADEATAFKLV